MQIIPEMQAERLMRLEGTPAFALRGQRPTVRGS